MKVALLSPRFGSPFSYKPPLGLAYLSAMLEENDIDNIILYGEEYENFEQFKVALKKIKPDYLGIAVMSCFSDNSLKAAKCAKEVLPQIKVIAGGPHPTIDPEGLLKNPSIDIVCVGEGELTLPEIIQCKDLEKVDGILFKKNGKIIRTKPRPFIQDLDSLPLPARHKLKMEKHVRSRTTVPILYPSTTLTTSRGCPGNCSFCQPTLRKLFGGQIRHRGVDSVIKEMVLLQKTYGLSSLYFNDNELTSGNDWIHEFCDELVKRKIKIPWGCASRVNNLDEELVKKMKAAGCFFITMGVESGSQNVLNFYRKGITVKQIVDAYDLCKKYKILTLASLMVGGLEETEEDVEKTISLVKRIKPDLIMVNVTTPLIGTDLYSQAKKHKLLCNNDMANLERHNLTTMKRKFLSDEDIKRLMLKVFKAYKIEMLKILINPVLWFKRFYTIKGLASYWFALAKSPRLIFSGLKWYFNVLLVRGVKRGKDL